MKRHHLPVAFIDTETTGFEPKKGAVLTEVAAVRWNSAGHTSFSTLVKADDADFAWAAMNAHHLRPEDTAQAPKRDAVIRELRSFLNLHGIRHIVAHNAEFDARFLPELNDFIWIDSLKLARRADQAASTHSNFGLFHGWKLDRFHVANGTSHRALTDCLATSAVFDAALDRLGLPDDCDINEVVRLHELKFKVEYFWYSTKHRGMRIADIDSGFLRWALNTIQDMDMDSRRSIARELANRRARGSPQLAS